jgi:hypothetical protein
VASLDPGRPDAGEHIPYYAQYIRLVPDGDIIAILERQVHETAAFFASFSPEQARERPAPGEWNAIEIAGHLADVERVFAYRALRIARADPAFWEDIDFDAYATEAVFNQRDLASVVEEFAAVRSATVALLRGLNRAAWTRRMPATWTTRSVRAIAYALAGHELHHLAGLRA